MIERVPSVASALLRTLHADPQLAVADAVARVESVLQSLPYYQSPLEDAREMLRTTAARIRRRGVLNPVWLMRARNIHLYHYMVRAQAGWRQFLEKQASASEHTTYYFLYGDWDALISLHGIDREAATLMDRIAATTPYEWVDMMASQVLLFHRYRTREPGPGTLVSVGDAAEISADLVNAIVEEYDDARFAAERVELEESGVFLGPTWQLDDSDSAADIGAYVGINARGPVHNLRPQELLEELLSDEGIRTCLVHLMELDRAKPFQYLAKVVCGDLGELTRVTDALVARRLGRVTIETTTFIIARGMEALPSVSGQRSPDIVTPDTRGLESVAQATLGRLGPTAIASFNSLDPQLQPMVLDSLYELQDRMTDGPWDEKTGADLDAALQLFSQAALDGVPPGSLHGPVINVARVVEAVFKDALYRIVRRVYGGDLPRAQRELKLRTTKFHEMALGNIAATLRTVRGEQAFAFVGEVLEDEWLDRLERFTDTRNRWAHAGKQTSSPPRVEISEARHVFNSGIDLIRWLQETVLPTLHRDGEAAAAGTRVAEITLPASASRRFGVFISHAFDDASVAVRIADGLLALNYPVWYAGWAIRAGDSIAAKVSDGLVQNSILLVLLSPRSVASRWVRHEFTTALVDQLAGQDVTVVPVLIESCEVPAVLRGIRSIDMRPASYQSGFIELIEFLQARKP